MTDTNHVGDINEMVSDAVAKCESCGVPWAEHMGIMGVCATNAQLRKERDAARRLACGALASGGWDLFAKPDDWGVDRGRDLCMRDQADERNWDCFKEETP